MLSNYYSFLTNNSEPKSVDASVKMYPIKKDEHLIIATDIINGFHTVINNSVNGVFGNPYNPEDSDKYCSFANECHSSFMTVSSLREKYLCMKDEFGNSPIRHACEFESLNYIKCLFLMGADINKIDSYGDSLLHSACCWGNDKQTVQWLIEHGLDINLKNDNGDTPLHCAYDSQCYEIIELLISFGANTDILNDYDETPSMLAW